MDSAAHSRAKTSVIGEDSKIPSKRDLFLSTYQPHQPWSLSDSIIYYISKYPSSSKVYQKLIQSCKYFFIKYPIIVIPHLSRKYQNNEWKTMLKRRYVEVKAVSSKLWVTHSFWCCNNVENVNDQYITTSLVPKIFKSDFEFILLENHNIAFNVLIFLASKCKDIRLYNVTVLDENGSVVAVEKIVEAFPLVKEFYFHVGGNNAATEIITSKTAKNLIKIPNFAKIEFFKLCGIPECFDIDTFFSYIKKNKITQISLQFAQNISEDYRNRLQIIVNEIIEAEIRDYRPPYIYFHGMDESSERKLLNLFFR